MCNNDKQDNASKIVISGIDGVIALNQHRLHWLDTGKHYGMSFEERWRKYYVDAEDDKPNLPVIQILRALHQAGHKIHIFSERPDEYMDETLQWLCLHDVPSSLHTWKKTGNYTPDEVLKKLWLSKYDKSEILCVFEYRAKLVEMWRAEGLTCLQVAPGEF